MEQDLNAILEQQLRGLHTPEATGIWPPAFGWWILAALLLGLLIFTVYKIQTSRKANAYKRRALLELNQIHTDWQQGQQTKNYLQSINTLIKRALLSSGVNKEQAAETGSNWAYILRTASKKPLNDEAIFALTTALYQENPEVDVKTLHPAVRSWLAGHTRKKDKVGGAHA